MTRLGVTEEGSDGRGEEGEAFMLGMVKGFGISALRLWALIP